MRARSRAGVGVGVALAAVVTASVTTAMVEPASIDSAASTDGLAPAVRSPESVVSRPPSTVAPTTIVAPSTTVAPTTTVAARPTAIVSLGDSFISGEAGRWFGNSNASVPGYAGTDRAYVAPGPADPRLVYGGTVTNGCHRSDVAPIMSTSIDVDVTINVACSGARTEHVVDTSFRGEAPQSEQLEQIARDHDVRLVVLSIGGNDLRFAEIVANCAMKFTSDPGPVKDVCNDEEQPLVDGDMAAAMAGVEASIEAIRAAMSAAGSSPGDYRLVVASYASPIGRGKDIRFPEDGASRIETGKCPLWNEDATWARDSLTPQIADNLRVVADRTGTEFLDLRDAFSGREACSSATTRPGPREMPAGSTSEWTRWFETSPQGAYQESAHPSVYGQQALGRCLSLLWVEPPNGEWSCTNRPDRGPSAMLLAAL